MKAKLSQNKINSNFFYLNKSKLQNNSKAKWNNVVYIFEFVQLLFLKRIILFKNYSIFKRWRAKSYRFFDSIEQMVCLKKPDGHWETVNVPRNGIKEHKNRALYVAPMNEFI